jgi:hypothetical protein
MLRCYPLLWRQRYGVELLDILDQHEVTGRTVLNLFLHAVRARLKVDLTPEAGVAMPRLRLRLVVLAAVFPLYAVAFASWFSVDEPVDSDLIKAAAGDRVPIYRVAEAIVGLGLIAVAITLIVTAAFAATLRAREALAARDGSTGAAIGYLLAAVLAVGGPAVFLLAWVTHPRQAPTHPQWYILALFLGVAVGLGVLITRAAGAPLNRRVAVVAAVPATVMSVIMLATSAALTAYMADMVAHGVPVITYGVVETYPVGAMPADHSGWLITLVVALVASLAAMVGAGYAAVGTVRAARFRPLAQPDDSLA